MTDFFKIWTEVVDYHKETIKIKEIDLAWYGVLSMEIIFFFWEKPRQKIFVFFTFFHGHCFQRENQILNVPVTRSTYILNRLNVRPTASRPYRLLRAMVVFLFRPMAMCPVADNPILVLFVWNEKGFSLDAKLITSKKPSVSCTDFIFQPFFNVACSCVR